VVDVMDVHGGSAMLAIEDGMDAVPQLSSLTQLLLDPHYRSGLLSRILDADTSIYFILQSFVVVEPEIGRKSSAKYFIVLHSAGL